VARRDFEKIQAELGEIRQAVNDSATGLAGLHKDQGDLTPRTNWSRHRGAPGTLWLSAKNIGPGCASTTASTSGVGSVRPSPGDPRAYGHVCLATNGRGIQFGQPA
jgi:hypothetical protein